MPAVRHHLNVLPVMSHSVAMVTNIQSAPSCKIFQKAHMCSVMSLFKDLLGKNRVMSLGLIQKSSRAFGARTMKACVARSRPRVMRLKLKVVCFPFYSPTHTHCTRERGAWYGMAEEERTEKKVLKSV